MHILGKSPEEYTDAKIGGMDSYWVLGYKETYEDAYKEGKSFFSPTQILSAIVSSIAADNDDNSGEMRHAGKTTGIMQGNADRKNGNINRLNPRSSIKRNSPLIVLKNKGHLHSKSDTQKNK